MRYLPFLLLTGCLDYASVSKARATLDGGKADDLLDGDVQADGGKPSADLAGMSSPDLAGPLPDMCGVVHDNGARISGAYGMLKTASSMHYGQLPGHTYVVIDASGVIRHVYDDPNMAIHNDQLIDELRKISIAS